MIVTSRYHKIIIRFSLYFLYIVRISILFAIENPPSVQYMDSSYYIRDDYIFLTIVCRVQSAMFSYCNASKIHIKKMCCIFFRGVIMICLRDTAIFKPPQIELATPTKHVLQYFYCYNNYVGNTEYL